MCPPRRWNLFLPLTAISARCPSYTTITQIGLRTNRTSNQGHRGDSPSPLAVILFKRKLITPSASKMANKNRSDTHIQQNKKKHHLMATFQSTAVLSICNNVRVCHTGQQQNQNHTYSFTTSGICRGEYGFKPPTEYKKNFSEKNYSPLPMSVFLQLLLFSANESLFHAAKCVFYPKMHQMHLAAGVDPDLLE